MPDYYDATIEFPEGVLTSDELKDLMPGECIPPEVLPGGTVRVQGYVASGEFTRLEERLKEVAVPFDRETGGDHQYMPFVLRYRPGAEDWTAEMDTAGTVVVPLPALMKAAQAGSEALAQLIARHNGPGPLREWIRVQEWRRVTRA